MGKKIIKVCIFNPHSTPSEVLESNGEAILDNICVSCETIESLDGTYELDATFIVDNEGLYKLISDESILKVSMDYGEEVFRVAKIQKGTRDIVIFARQITISETLDMWIEDTRPTNTSGLSALNTLKNNSIGKKDIQVFSNITNTSTAYYQRMSMYKAIHDCDQSFLTRWGGEVQRRCYNLTINSTIGSDRGVQIRSRKNLSGFEANTNIDNVVTRIRPIGYYGIDAGKFVDSPLINKYSAIKTKEIKYEDVKVKDESNPNEGYDTLKEAQAELIRRAELEFSQNHIDELRAEYIINFIYLEQTEEYKNFIQAERVYIGDTVQVYEEKHDINIHVRAIKRKFDVLRQKVIEIELSNTDISSKSITTSDIISELQSIISSSSNNNVQDIIQSMINSGIKDSYVIPRQNEIIIADNKDLNLANNVCRLNKNGLGFSKTGYYGTYEYGFTIDGVINANLIKAGVLSGITVESRGSGSRVEMEKDGLRFYSDNDCIGKVSFDDTGAGTVDEAKERLWVRTFLNYALKLEAANNSISISCPDDRNVYIKNMINMGTINSNSLKTASEYRSSFEIIDSIRVVNNVLLPSQTEQVVNNVLLPSQNNHNIDISEYVAYEVSNVCDDDGNIINEKINSYVNNNNIIALLLNAIKELKEEVSLLKQKI